MILGIISDTHIPWRAKSVPIEFMKWFENEKVELILHAGDLNEPKVIDILSNIAEVKAVKGNTDYIDLPKELIIKIEDRRILLFHSDNVYPRGDINKIAQYAKEKEVDIVVYGHTHIPIFTYKNGIYLLNPGSATGVRSGEINDCTKSAAIMEIKDDKIQVRFKNI